MNIQRYAGITILTLCLGACATTGDPRQGGLFAWDEEKAKQRQSDYDQRARQAQHEAHKQQQTRADLRQRKSSVKTERDKLRRVLNELEEETANLVRQLETIHAKYQSTEAKLDDKRKEREALLRERLVVNRNNKYLQTTDGFKSTIERTDDYNRRLSELLLYELQK